MPGRKKGIPRERASTPVLPQWTWHDTIQSRMMNQCNGGVRRLKFGAPLAATDRDHAHGKRGRDFMRAIGVARGGRDTGTARRLLASCTSGRVCETAV